MSKPIDQPIEQSTDCVATFVAAPATPLSSAMVTRAVRCAGLGAADIVWLEPGVAADVFFAHGDDVRLIAERLRAALTPARVDVIVQPVAWRRKMLLVADMDSTMIAQECIDELADCRGLRAQISVITEQAMRGEVDFEAALRARVSLLAGVTRHEIATIIARLTPTPGAQTLVATMRAHGALTALVSGGFAPFTDAVAQQLGFDETRANQLVFEKDVLTGAVATPVLGRAAKRAALEELRLLRKLPRDATLAIGDGANDLDMLAAAGLGVAWRAKPAVAAAAAARLDHTDLTALLYAQGYRRAEFVD